MGIFEATVYLEPAPGDHEKVRRGQNVEVFGEYTEHNPWGVKTRCFYDDTYKCFKADI